MAKSQFPERSQTQTEQERSLSRRDYSTFPSFGGELFNVSPFALIREMTDWMDRSITNTTPGAGGGRHSHVWAPAIEVFQKGNDLEVRADLPGIEPNDVKIEVENDLLVIQGERKQERTEEREGWHRSERVYGRFYRAIPLPEGAKTEQAKAEFRNGVLEVKIPVEQPKSNRRQIQIQGGNSTESSTTRTVSSGSSSGTPQGGQGGSVQR